MNRLRAVKVPTLDHTKGLANSRGIRRIQTKKETDHKSMLIQSSRRDKKGHQWTLVFVEKLNEGFGTTPMPVQW